MVTEHRTKNDDYDELDDDWGDMKIFADEELIDGTNEFVNEALLGKVLIILN